jgi:hypothetical protein
MNANRALQAVRPVVGLSLAALTGGIAAATLAIPGALAAPAATKTVSFQGHAFLVPASWPVLDLTADPSACVRFDQHAVYLGTAGADQNCPAGLRGRTEALLVEPAATTGRAATTTENTAGHEFTSTGSGFKVTVSYGTDRATATAILASAKLPSTGPLPTTPAAPLPTAGITPALAGSVTDDTGQGFDPCAAPSSGAMSAWKSASPYGAIGIYIGGANRACAQPNLTANWITQQVSAGWKLFPLYVGPQASTGSCHGCTLITSPTSQGSAAADDAANQAAALDISGGVIYYDMESYPSSQSGTALTFEAAWTNELHARGYRSGVYSSAATGIADMVNHYNSYPMPDVVDIADYPGSGGNTTADPYVPANLWANHQRIHQYSGGHNETHGGYTINIDQDYLDVQVGDAANRQVYEASSGNAWRDLPMTGVTGSAVAAIEMGGTKFVYTVNNGQLYEASSANGWQDLPTGVAGTDVAAIAVGTTKFIYTIHNGAVYEASSANGWQALPTGVAGTDVAAIAVGTTKFIYTIHNGAVYEASSANGWQALPTGVAGTDVAAATMNGVKYVYTVSGGAVYEAASDNAWRDLPMGVAGTAVAATTMNGVKYVYTVSGGAVYEAASDNAWRDLPMGVNGTGIAAIAFNGTKFLYNL